MDPGTAEHRRASVARLRHAVQRLTLDASAQVAQFPAGVLVPDEMALDLNHGLDVCRAWGYLDASTLVPLTEMEEILGRMSGLERADRWTIDALSMDPAWQHLRSLARKALVVAGWATRVPPTPEQEGTTFVR